MAILFRYLSMCKLSTPVPGNLASDTREIPRPAGENAGLRDDASYAVDRSRVFIAGLHSIR